MLKTFASNHPGPKPEYLVWQRVVVFGRQSFVASPCLRCAQKGVSLKDTLILLWSHLDLGAVKMVSISRAP